MNKIYGVFAQIETFLTFFVGVFIALFVIIALFGVIASMQIPLFVTHDFTQAAINGIDAAFLAIILLELLHTIRSRETPIQQLEEFLIIGVTSAVRHGLEIAATSTTASNEMNVVINLGINAGAVLILAIAFWLVKMNGK